MLNLDELQAALAPGQLDVLSAQEAAFVIGGGGSCEPKKKSVKVKSVKVKSKKNNPPYCPPPTPPYCPPPAPYCP